MADLSKLIKRFVQEHIALSQKDISESAKSREWFLSKIKSKVEEKTNEPSLYQDTPFIYFGSYFKGTKVSDVDEYDVLVVIDSNTGQFTQSDTKTGEGLGNANPNHKYDAKYKKSDGSGVSPAKMLNWLKSIVEEVAESFGGSAPERSGQAITATIASKNVKIDLVPAGIFKHTQRTGTLFYNIPKGDKNNGWIVTSPKQDMELLSALAKDRSDFKNVIRILKYIKQKYNFLVSSFAIECSVVQLVQYNSWANVISKDLILAMQYVANALKEGKIVDSFDSNNNLLSNVDNLSWYAERLEKIIEVLNNQTSEYDEEKAYQRICKTFSNE
ncbi:MAG: hypothetical protein KJ995_07995 [Candidatus Omnitrophica bacterium]|nr:hypothetical protein [Candidatus Omnitrophota bacterium]MBU1852327.1 hypothetical protein [Candidatus Omnitrophota bacterium]